VSVRAGGLLPQLVSPFVIKCRARGWSANLRNPWAGALQQALPFLPMPSSPPYSPASCGVSFQSSTSARPANRRVRRGRSSKPSYLLAAARRGCSTASCCGGGGAGDGRERRRCASPCTCVALLVAVSRCSLSRRGGGVRVPRSCADPGVGGPQWVVAGLACVGPCTDFFCPV
jgi:hypothetical protein